jgi:hypothetical protein
MDPYEWDEAKNDANQLKHGIGFELIYEFDWSKAVVEADDRFDYGEGRGLAYGRIDGRGYAVVFVIRGDHVRIISIRRMHEKELKLYDL